MGVYRLELSKSGRALCKNAECKNNGVKIGKGELRWCTLATIKENQSWQYKHWGCVTPKQIENLKETIEDDLDLLDGYEELDTESQNKVRKALTDGHVDNSDWKGDPEQNRPGKNGFRSPKKRVKSKVEDSGNEDGAPTPTKPSTKKRGRAKLEQDEGVVDANKLAAKKAKKSSTGGKQAKDDALNDSEPETQTSRKVRGKGRKSKAQVETEQFNSEEEINDGDTIHDNPQKKTSRTRRSAKPKVIKSEEENPSMGAEVSGDASNLRRSRKKAAVPSKIKSEDEERDHDSEQEIPKVVVAAAKIKRGYKKAALKGSDTALV